MLIVVLVVTVLFVLFLRKNPMGREFFDRARTLIAVNLLKESRTPSMLPLGTERGLAFKMDPLTSPFVSTVKSGFMGIGV